MASLVERLREHATDWDGRQMPDAEPAKGDPTAGTLRQAATAITTLEAELAEAQQQVKGALIMHEALSEKLEITQDELAAMKQKRLCDHGRLLFRDDVERHCANPDICFEYGGTVRCSPCAIKQADAEGIETLDIERVYLPEVARLNRELAAMKALADRLAEFSVHRAECARKRIHFTAVSPDCTCGLTQALTDWRDHHHGGNDADT